MAGLLGSTLESPLLYSMHIAAAFIVILVALNMSLEVILKESYSNLSALLQELDRIVE